MKTIFKNCSIVFKKYINSIDGIVFPKEISNQYKNAFVDISIEMLDESFDLSSVPQMYVYVIANSTQWRLVQLAFTDNKNVLVFTNQVAQTKPSDKIEKTILVPWHQYDGLYADKFRIHMTINWDSVKNLSTDFSYLGESSYIYINLIDIKRYEN